MKYRFSLLRPIFVMLFMPFLYLNILFFSRLKTVFLVIVTLILALYIERYLRILIWAIIRTPALILTDETITITESNYVIYWKDIISLYMASDASSNTVNNPIRYYYVMIKVRDPHKYIDDIKNPIIRYYRWYTRKWSDTPFQVRLSSIKGDDDEIYHNVLRYYQNNRGF
jgi:hypothetical protein